MNIRWLPVFFIILSTYSQAQFKPIDAQQNIKNYELNNPASFIGKRYWTSPSGNGIIGEVTFLDQPSNSKRFVVTEDSQFTVLELFESQQSSTTYLKVQFNDANKTTGYVALSEFLKKMDPPKTPFFHWSFTTFNISSEAPPSKVVRNLIEASKAEEFSKLEANQKILSDAIAARNSNPPRIGMGMTQVKKSSWGEPIDINRTIVSGRTHEQWVYAWGYVYLENGVVTAIQD